MTVFTPKEQFQQFHERERDEWRAMSGGRTVQMVMSHALAHMGFCGCSNEELRGANLFINTALTLAEKEISAPDKYPAVPLQDETVKPA